jgi:hypothetical protein
MIREVAQRMETTHCNAFRNVCRLDVCSLLLQLLSMLHELGHLVYDASHLQFGLKLGP